MINSVNYIMPAEWEKHSAVWLAWPHDEISFPGRIDKAENAVIKIISAIYQNEQVELLVLNDLMLQRTSTLMQKAAIDISKIRFHITTYMDGWMRDCGGIFVKGEDGKLKLVNWIFNQWGNKFPDLKIDAEIPKKVAQWTGVEILEPGIVLEGGAIDVNGQGTLLTTEQCLLNPNRNPTMTKGDYEKNFADYLGVKKTIWLNQGLLNDHTDGHIDDIARFVSPNTIVVAYEDDQNEENFKTLDENYKTISESSDQNGKPFKVVQLPMPHMSYGNNKPFEGGNKAPVSYTNFYIGNGIVLVPTFNDPNDTKALKIIQSLFPNRKVVGIDCSEIIYGGGAIHCMTQQVPDLS